MRRGSGSKNFSNINPTSTFNNKNTKSIFALKRRPIKKSSTLGDNLKSIIKELKNKDNIFAKSKFSKDPKNTFEQNNKNNKEPKNDFFKIFNLNKNDYSKFNYNKFIIFRKSIYKIFIIDKYYQPYLKLKNVQKESYLRESQYPKKFHGYLINYILKNKRCRIAYRFNEMVKNIDQNDYLIYNYDIYQSTIILRYLLGHPYNKDKYTYNKLIDSRTNKERISINYKHTFENIINIYNKNKSECFKLMLNEYISKMENKKYNYILNNKFYQYIFAEEIPFYQMPNIIPNYLCFEEKIKKMMKKLIHEYKTRKIKTKYIKSIENKKYNDKNKKIKKLEENIDENSSSESQSDFNYKRDIYEKVKKSFSEKNEKINNQKYSFSSSQSLENFPSSIFFENKKDDKYSSNHIFIFSKHKMKKVDKRIKNDEDIIEVEKVLQNFNANKNKKLKSNIKDKLKNEIFKSDNINLNKILEKRNLLKENLKNNLPKISLKKEDELKSQSKFFKKKSSEIIKSYNEKNNVNDLNDENIFGFLKDEKKHFIKKIKKKKKKKSLDFKSLIFKIISNSNYSTYNKKYRYHFFKEDSDFKNFSIQKTERTTEKKKKFKNTLDFLKDFNKNKKQLQNNNKLINHLIVETEYDNELIYRKKNHLKNFHTFTSDTKLQDNPEFKHKLSKLNFIFNKIKRKAEIKNEKKNNFFHNVKTSKEILKYGDIYF